MEREKERKREREKKTKREKESKKEGEKEKERRKVFSAHRIHFKLSCWQSENTVSIHSRAGMRGIFFANVAFCATAGVP